MQSPPPPQSSPIERRCNADLECLLVSLYFLVDDWWQEEHSSVPRRPGRPAVSPPVLLSVSKERSKGKGVETVAAQVFTFVIALVTALAGVVMLWLGYKLSVAQTRLEGLGNDNSPARNAIRTTVQNANAITQKASEVADHAAAMAEAASQEEQIQQHADEINSATQAITASIGPTADYVRALAELTKNLSGLTPAVSAFVVSTILFIVAGTIVTVGL